MRIGASLDRWNRQSHLLRMPGTPKTVQQYLSSLPQDRREAINAVRKVILKNLPKGYEEQISYGMIGYVVPHSLYPAGYHCDPRQPLPMANLGSKKNHLSLHLMTVYGDAATEKWFRNAWTATGKKLDMGKACVRFKKAEDIPLEVLGELIARVPVDKYVARVEKILSDRKPRKRA